MASVEVTNPRQSIKQLQFIAGKGQVSALSGFAAPKQWEAVLRFQQQIAQGQIKDTTGQYSVGEPES